MNGSMYEGMTPEEIEAEQRMLYGREVPDQETIERHQKEADELRELIPRTPLSDIRSFREDLIKKWEERNVELNDPLSVQMFGDDIEDTTFTEEGQRRIRAELERNKREHLGASVTHVLLDEMGERVVPAPSDDTPGTLAEWEAYIDSRHEQSNREQRARRAIEEQEALNGRTKPYSEGLNFLNRAQRRALAKNARKKR